MCSKIPDVEYQLPNEPDNDFLERMSFLRDD